MDGLAKAKPEPLSVHQPLQAVAYSGGADSTALLLETLRRHPKQTIAFHVHHGLQAAADDFVVHCQKFCATRQIPLYVAYIDATHAPGQSPEDAARQARYQALIGLAHQHGVSASQGCVLLGHHADDQVETLLLALSRGAGLAGLAAMPVSFQRGGILFKRPLLHRLAAAIRQELSQAGIAYLQDPSNQNKDFTRNKIRLELLPVLAKVFPQYTKTFTRSIAHAAQANELLIQVAQQDLLLTGVPPKLARLQQLPQNRMVNCLRYWLKHEYAQAPTTAQMHELTKQIAACQTRAHKIHLKIGAGFINKCGDALHYALHYNDRFFSATQSQF